VVSTSSGANFRGRFEHSVSVGGRSLEDLVVVSIGSTLNRRGCVEDAILNVSDRATQRFLAHNSSYVHAKSHTDVTASVDGVLDRQRALDLVWGLVQVNQLVCRRTRGTVGINRNEEQHSHVPSLSMNSCVL
jgi:hypothetical protein